MNIDFVTAAKNRIDPFIVETPLVRCFNLEKSSSKIYLKCENFQRTRSFKVRGAMNRLLTLDESQLSRGVVARSSGNFAQALAYGSQLLGVDATIVMPANAPEVKRSRTDSYNPNLILHDGTSTEGDLLVKQLVKESGLTELSGYDDHEVMAGQGTAGLEIAKVLPQLDVFFCPIGGGGLLSGMGTAIKSKYQNCLVVGVEPVGADDYAQSRQQGRRVELATVDTIADGLRLPTVGEFAYPILNRVVDEVVCVSDEEILNTMAYMKSELGMLVEPSGAVGLAGLRKFELEPNCVALALLSGGNVDES